MKVPVFLKKHGTELLFGTCIAGMFAGAVWACAETPKALKGVKEAEKKKSKALEIVKHYVGPAAVMAASTGGLVYCMHKKNQEISALSLAVAASESALFDYRDKVKEVLGEKKSREVDDRIAEEKVQAAPLPHQELPQGKMWVFDEWSGRYFMSDPETIRSAFNTTYDRLKREEYLTVNDFFDEVHEGPYTTAGDEYGWNDNDRGAKAFTVEFTSVLKDDTTPCLAFRFNRPPRLNYIRSKD